MLAIVFDVPNVLLSITNESIVEYQYEIYEIYFR
jgi:hypothetical protein